MIITGSLKSHFAIFHIKHDWKQLPRKNFIFYLMQKESKLRKVPKQPNDMKRVLYLEPLDLIKQFCSWFYH